MTIDDIVSWIMQGALSMLLLVAIGFTLWPKRQTGGIRGNATATRGEPSMNFLFVSYGVVTLVYVLSIQVAETFLGHKTACLVLDYAAFTYLFFFNSWFRNRLLFRIHNRIQKD